jgi:hypothetical protein
MDMNKENIKAQESLSSVNVDFLEYVKRNPATLKRSSFNLLELNDILFTLQPWPTFISPETKKSFQEAGVKLFDLIKQIPRRVFNNDPYKISEYFNFPVTVAKLQLTGVDDDQINYLLARGDFIISAVGLKCLEYNVSANLGGVMVPIWEELYLKTPIISQFLKEFNVKTRNENLIALILEHSLSLPLKKRPDYEDEELNIAIIMEKVERNESNRMRSQLYLNTLYKKVLESAAGSKALKGQLFLCDFHHLTLTDGYVFYNDKKITVLIEMYHGMVPPKIIDSFVSRKLYMINGPISNLLANKLTLAVLSDHENNHVFTNEEKEIIDRYIPWTRKIIPGPTKYEDEKIASLEHFVRSNREKLVIKPSRGLGGEGICVGIKSSQQEWETALNKAIKEKDRLVQEYVDSSPGIYQSGEEGCDLQDMVWGLFIAGSRCLGAWNRVMPKSDSRGVINCHQGATVSVIFEVDH